MEAILAFRSEQFYLFFLSTSHPHASYQVSSELAFGFRRISEKQISRWPHCGHLAFLIGTILAIFDLPVTPMLPAYKIDSQDGGHLGFPLGTVIAIFDLQVTPKLPTQVRVNWPFDSGEEVKNRF